MKISKNSWHYRWLRKIHVVSSWERYSLCSYFWAAVFGIVIVPIIALILSVSAALPLWWWLTDGDLFNAAVFIGSVEVFTLSCVLYGFRQERIEDEILEGKRERKEPSLTVQWLKAKHEKVCPLIEFD